MAIDEGNFTPLKPKIVTPPTPTKTISKGSYGAPAKTQPWQSGIYGGIPPGVLPHFPAQYSGVPTGFTNLTGSASMFLNSMQKPPVYYAPHEPIGPTYYPPQSPSFAKPDVNLGLSTSLASANWSGGGGGWGGGGGGGGGAGFTMGLINWRI